MTRLTDMGNAEALIAEFGEDLLYCPQVKEWYMWDGRRWKEDVGRSIVQHAKDIARSYVTAAGAYNKEDPRHKALMKHADSSENIRGIQAMITLAQSDAEVLCHFDEFNGNDDLLYVENGVLNLGTMEFDKFARGDYVTKIAPVLYQRGAISKKWEGFLLDVLPDEGTRNFVQRAVGYSLTGNTEAEVMFMLYGSGQNGKTTFVSAILNMLGEYAAQASSSALMHSKSDGPSNELYVLIGKRFVAAAETGESRQLNENLIKQMTGMDRISVNPKYKSQVEFMPTWKIWLSTNHEPTIAGNDSAIWRRIRKIPFEVAISSEKRDPKLKQALLNDRQERSGILNWALEGVEMWREQGLEPSKEVHASTHAYRAEQDLIGQFIEDSCQRHPSLVVAKAQLYRVYVAYCRDMNEQPKQKNGFGAQLRERGIKDDRAKGGRIWVGLGIDDGVNLNPKEFE